MLEVWSGGLWGPQEAGRGRAKEGNGRKTGALDESRNRFFVRRGPAGAVALPFGRGSGRSFLFQADYGNSYLKYLVPGIQRVHTR